MGPTQGQKPQHPQQLASFLQRIHLEVEQLEEVKDRRNRRDIAKQDVEIEGLQRKQTHEDGQGNQQLVQKGTFSRGQLSQIALLQ